MTPSLALFAYERLDNYWIAAAVGALAGVYIFYGGFCILQRKRLILNTPASKIRSASMGLVEVSGLAMGPYTVNAPVTGLPCYYYRTIAWQWERRGKSSEWVKVADENMHVPFYLDDNTGRLLVDPQGAELDIHRDFHDEFSNSFFPSSLAIPSNVASFLSRNGVSGEKKVKVEEYCIKPKNALFILGTLASNPGLTVSATPIRSLVADRQSAQFRLPAGLAGLSFRTDGTSDTSSLSFTAFRMNQPQETVRRSASNPVTALGKQQQEKVTAAMMKAGITNPAAWAVAGVSPAAAFPGSSANAGAAAAPGMEPEQFDLHPSTVLMKGAHNPAFYISWRSQREVVQALGWKSALMIWGGPALTLVCVYLLSGHFDWL